VLQDGSIKTVLLMHCQRTIFFFQYWKKKACFLPNILPLLRGIHFGTELFLHALPTSNFRTVMIFFLLSHGHTPPLEPNFSRNLKQLLSCFLNEKKNTFFSRAFSFYRPKAMLIGKGPKNSSKTSFCFLSHHSFKVWLLKKLMFVSGWVLEKNLPNIFKQFRSFPS